MFTQFWNFDIMIISKNKKVYSLSKLDSFFQFYIFSNFNALFWPIEGLHIKIFLTLICMTHICNILNFKPDLFLSYIFGASWLEITLLPIFQNEYMIVMHLLKLLIHYFRQLEGDCEIYRRPQKKQPRVEDLLQNENR